MDNLSDEQLALEAAGGRRGAFDELVRRYQDLAWRLASRYVYDFEERKELTQEIFLRVFSKIGSFRGDAKFSTWLTRFIINTSLEHRRKGWREEQKKDNFSREAISQEAGFQNDLRDVNISQYVDGLPDRQKETVLLRIYEDLSVEETAQVLGIAQGTVKSNLSKAMENLKRMMGDE